MVCIEKDRNNGQWLKCVSLSDNNNNDDEEYYYYNDKDEEEAEAEEDSDYDDNNIANEYDDDVVDNSDWETVSLGSPQRSLARHTAMRRRPFRDLLIQVPFPYTVRKNEMKTLLRQLGKRNSHISNVFEEESESSESSDADESDDIEEMYVKYMKRNKRKVFLMKREEEEIEE